MGSINVDTRFVFLGVFLLGTFIGLSAGVRAANGNLGFGDGTTQPGTNTGNTDTGNDEISIEGEPVKGDADAPVTMVIFEDLQCPFCQRFEQGALPDIVSEYVDSGQVKLVWKDMPLGKHSWAKDGAVAMECVYREGGSEAFWATKNKVFDNQNVVTTNSVNDQIARWASDNGVSESEVRSCIKKGDAIEEVEEDMREGRSLGVGTPTTFINGKKMVGAQPFSQFKAVIGSKLK